MPDNMKYYKLNNMILPPPIIYCATSSLLQVSGTHTPIASGTDIDTFSDICYKQLEVIDA